MRHKDGRSRSLMKDQLTRPAGFLLLFRRKLLLLQKHAVPW